MSADGHLSPSQIHSRLNHPVIDGDGHWVEYDPVFSEQMRKVGGDKAADAFLAVGKGTKEVQKSTVEERKRRRLGQEGFWSRAEKNTRDRATGLFPRFLYERLGARHRLRGHLPHGGAPRAADHRRRGAARRLPRVQHRHRGLFP